VPAGITADGAGADYYDAFTQGNTPESQNQQQPQSSQRKSKPAAELL
jgi:hypothetical protein